MQNLYSTKDDLLSREDKEKLLAQNGICIWLTGLSGSGKQPLPIMQVECYTIMVFTLKFLMEITLDWNQQNFLSLMKIAKRKYKKNC